jgi:hypothetical protein
MYNSVERSVSYKFCKSFDKRLANTRKRPVICPVFFIFFCPVFCPVFLREVGGRTAIAINKSVVMNALQDKQISGLYGGVDKRKGKLPHNKTPDEKLQQVRTHIESFDTVESHYIRPNNSARYFAPGLNMTEMYRQYVNDLAQKKIIPVKKDIYRG